MKEVVLGPNENVYSKGEFISRLYFIKSGQIELYDTKNSNINNSKNYWSFGFLKVNFNLSFFLFFKIY